MQLTECSSSYFATVHYRVHQESHSNIQRVFFGLMDCFHGRSKLESMSFLLNYAMCIPAIKFFVVPRSQWLCHGRARSRPSWPWSASLCSPTSSASSAPSTSERRPRRTLSSFGRRSELNHIVQVLQLKTFFLQAGGWVPLLHGVRAAGLQERQGRAELGREQIHCQHLRPGRAIPSEIL